ncbi:MAG: RNA methyltransferase [Pseudomonadales bacterium]|nr:RNA methyltransferase [Pseudomonadales bacterium]
MNTSNIYIGLCNPKTPTNVGSVMRAAGCYSADAVFYTGRRYNIAAGFHTDTHNSSLTIPLVSVDSLLNEIPENTQVVCVELVEGATSLPEFKHPDKAFYIFGPEDGSVPKNLVDRADAVVYIPTKGSLNLAQTVNVVLYDRLAKSDSSQMGDELIREARDRNNRLKI